MKRRFWLSTVFVLSGMVLSALAEMALAEQGIRGRASLGGELVADVEIRAYPYRPGGFGPLTGERSANRTRTATDGSYRLPLPAGHYVVEALFKKAGNLGERPQTGDLHCLYSGSPVTVVVDGWTPVGLNMVRVPEETRDTADRTGLRGQITREGIPQEKVYLYIYENAGSAFRGPARLLQPVSAGTFRIRLPAGSYQLVARKRVRGGAYGPIEIGDLFNFYPRNPVVVAEGEEVSLEIPLVERLSQLEEESGAFAGLRVRVVGKNGSSVPGYYVLAYATANRTGPPLATSTATDATGRTVLPAPPEGTLYLRARPNVGGPLVEGQAYADSVFEGRLSPDIAEVVLVVNGDS